MTSNAGAAAIQEPKKLGFLAGEDEKQNYQRMKGNVMEEVKRVFKPEFLNRIDEIIVFHSLNKEEIAKIVALLLKEFEKRCKDQMDIELHVRDSVKKHIAETGYDAKYVKGSVNKGKGLAPHAWVEIKSNGKTYVYDPNFQSEFGKKGYTGYKITYGQKGTLQYVKTSKVR